MPGIEYLQSAPLVISVTPSRVFKVGLAPGGRFPRSSANHAVDGAFHPRSREPGLVDTSAAPKCWRETLPSETCVTARTGKDTPPLDETWRGKGHQQ